MQLLGRLSPLCRLGPLLLLRFLNSCLLFFLMFNPHRQPVDRSLRIPFCREQVTLKLCYRISFVGCQSCEIKRQSIEFFRSVVALKFEGAGQSLGKATSWQPVPRSFGKSKPLSRVKSLKYLFHLLDGCEVVSNLNSIHWWVPSKHMDISLYLYIHSTGPDKRRIKIFDVVGLLVKNYGISPFE